MCVYLPHHHVYINLWCASWPALPPLWSSFPFGTMVCPVTHLLLLSFDLTAISVDFPYLWPHGHMCAHPLTFHSMATWTHLLALNIELSSRVKPWHVPNRLHGMFVSLVCLLSAFSCLSFLYVSVSGFFTCVQCYVANGCLLTVFMVVSWLLLDLGRVILVCLVDMRVVAMTDF